MLGIQKGASVVRVHDIKETRQMIKIHQTFSDSILK
jgi:dihydropteroate synthase